MNQLIENSMKMGDASRGPNEQWTFQLGKFVSHKDLPLPSLVLSRVRTSHGKEVYGIRSFKDEDPNRDRQMFGDVLVAMDDDHPAWNECIIAGTPFDPRGPSSLD